MTMTRTRQRLLMVAVVLLVALAAFAAWTLPKRMALRDQEDAPVPDDVASACLAEAKTQNELRDCLGVSAQTARQVREQSTQTETDR